MNNRHVITTLFVVLVFSVISFKPAFAAGEYVKPPQIDWSFNGPFGTYDRAALQRGFKVYKNVCAACHAMKHLHYRNLTALGYDENQVKNIAAEYTVTDGPNDEGEMFERAAIPSDRFVSPYPNKNAAKAANGGAYPPDMSLLVKARKDGANYMYGVLTGYVDTPEYFVEKNGELLPGQYYNKYMPGHIIAMAAPLSDGMVPYEDGSPETMEQYSKDVTHFLKWAADPYMEDRKQMGVRVILFLIAFAAVMYAVKKRLWAELH